MQYEIGGNVLKTLNKLFLNQCNTALDSDTDDRKGYGENDGNEIETDIEDNMKLPAKA